MKIITSAENVDFKHALKLAEQARERKKSQQTLLDGEHLVSAYCAGGNVPEQLFVTDRCLEDARNKTRSKFAGAGVFKALLEAGWSESKLIVVTPQLMRQLSSLESPSTMIAVARQPENAALPNHQADIVALENLQDPGNMGTILRSAAAAGFAHVLCSPDCVAVWSPKVLRAAQGAHFNLKITEGVDLTTYVAAAKQKSYALALQASKSIYECDFLQPSIILIGNEGAGLSTALLQVTSQPIRIPMPGKVESLNAAVAASICLFEVVRQRVA